MFWSDVLNEAYAQTLFWLSIFGGIIIALAVILSPWLLRYTFRLIRRRFMEGRCKHTQI
jgi:hypothetical protein